VNAAKVAAARERALARVAEGENGLREAIEALAERIDQVSESGWGDDLRAVLAANPAPEEQA
jgi:hypothetical protein